MKHLKTLPDRGAYGFPIPNILSRCAWFFSCSSYHGCRFALPVVIDIFPLQGKRDYFYFSVDEICFISCSVTGPNNPDSCGCQPDVVNKPSAPRLVALYAGKLTL